MAQPTPSTPSETQGESNPHETVADGSTRPYIRIKPTDDSLDPQTVYGQFRRLQQIARSDPTDGLLDRLRGATAPTIEFLLVSEATSDATLTYYGGIDDPDAFEELHRILRGVFPNSYEFERVEWSPDRLVPDENSERNEDDIEAVTFAGVEFQGRTDHRRDWQTKLTPFEEFTSREDDSHSRIPLTAVVEAMAERESAMVSPSSPCW